MAEDETRSPSRPRIQSRRRLLNTRACDRCRRRKAKCDARSPRDRCSLCREVGEPCTFDLPLARRGPKTRKRSEGLTLESPSNSPSGGNQDRALPLVYTACQAGSPLSGLGYVGHAAGSPPVAPWPPTPGITADQTSPSAQTARSSGGGASDQSTGTGAKSALHRWQSLSRSLALVNLDIERITTQCLDLFFQYLYPLTPLVHEPSLRSGLAYFLSQGSSNLNQLPHSAAVPSSAGGDTWTGIQTVDRGGTRGITDPWWPDSTFSLLTAVCAEAAFLLPKDLFPEGPACGEIFLHASRSCLANYLEADLEAPNANSVAIRYFHSNCVHAAGKPKYSWHIFGEATRLAQVMQLHQESSLEGLLPIEAELRRRAFWIVYMGDKSAAILNSRPITIHRFSFESGITTAYPTGIEDEESMVGGGPSPAGAPSSPGHGRRCFIDGFNANLRLWQAASDLLLEIRLLQDRGSTLAGNLTTPVADQHHRQHLDDLYIQFITCLDNLPPYLQSYTFAAGPSGSDQGSSNSINSQFAVQCANLQVSLHCLRMVMTQKFDETSYFGTTSAEQADLRRTEIARDMLRVMREAPFWSLQVNGEPYVEKIRLVGASLLAIIHRNQGSPLAARARSDFSVLLDILTRLDSKASDALRSDSTWIGSG